MTRLEEVKARISETRMSDLSWCVGRIEALEAVEKAAIAWARDYRDGALSSHAELTRRALYDSVRALLAKQARP